MTSNEMFSFVDLMIVVLSLILIRSSARDIWAGRKSRGSLVIVATILGEIIYLFLLRERTETYFLTLHFFITLMLLCTCFVLNMVVEEYIKKYGREPKGWNMLSIVLVSIALAVFLSFMYVMAFVY